MTQVEILKELHRVADMLRDAGNKRDAKIVREGAERLEAFAIVGAALMRGTP